MRIGTLPNTIRERSDAYNTTHINATFMEDGTQWPGTWIDPTENHKKDHHASIVQVKKSRDKILCLHPCMFLLSNNFNIN
jgi:hypothetical protein